MECKEQGKDPVGECRRAGVQQNHCPRFGGYSEEATSTILSHIKYTSIANRKSSLRDKALLVIITERKLFADENERRSSVNIALLMPFVKMNSEMKAGWDALGSDERNEWDKKAENLKASERKNLIYRYVYCIHLIIRD
jgi:hypothetical protein